MFTDQGATVCRVLTIMLNYGTAVEERAWEALTEHWLPSDEARVRSLSVEPRGSDLLQALAEKPQGQEATVCRATIVELLIYLRFEVLKFAAGHGPGQERLCSEA
jgi:hypothetical protein